MGIGRVGLCLVAGVLAAACATPHGRPYTLDESPLELVRTGPGFSDQRGRFREVLCAVNESHGRALPAYRPCEEILHRFADEPAGPGAPVELGVPRAKLRIVMVSGFAAQCAAGLVSAFAFALQHLEAHGYRTGEVAVDGLSSCSHNGAQIRDAVLAMDLAPDERVVLVGYSKGTPDILEGLAAYPELAERVAAVIGVVGAVYGSPLSEDAPESLVPVLAYLPGSQCDTGDGGALDSLDPTVRRHFLATHELPKTVRYYSLAAFANRDQTSYVLRGPWDDLARIDPRNDSQLLFYDQVLSDGALLGFAVADHWAIALPIDRESPTLDATLVRRNEFPREVLFEALIRHVEEKLLEAGAAEPAAEPQREAAAP